MKLRRSCRGSAPRLWDGRAGGVGLGGAGSELGEARGGGQGPGESGGAGWGSSEGGGGDQQQLVTAPEDRMSSTAASAASWADTFTQLSKSYADYM